MRLNLTATELRVGDQILTLNSIGGVKSSILVKKLGLCPGKTKGIRKVHVNETMCFDDVSPLIVQRGKVNAG